MSVIFSMKQPRTHASQWNLTWSNCRSRCVRGSESRTSHLLSVALRASLSFLLRLSSFCALPSILSADFPMLSLEGAAYQTENNHFRYGSYPQMHSVFPVVSLTSRQETLPLLMLVPPATCFSPCRWEVFCFSARGAVVCSAHREAGCEAAWSVLWGYSPRLLEEHLPRESSSAQKVTRERTTFQTQSRNTSLFQIKSWYFKIAQELQRHSDHCFKIIKGREAFCNYIQQNTNSGHLQSESSWQCPCLARESDWAPSHERHCQTQCVYPVSQ